MKNLWPEGFTENEKITARQMLEEQSKLLPKLTGDLVYAEVSELSPIEAARESLFRGELQGEFVYSFDIRGKFLEKYRFRVLSFSHDIAFYPVLIRLDELLGKELKIPEGPSEAPTITINEPEELEKFLSSVLRSERIGKVVGSLIKLSK